MIRIVFRNLEESMLAKDIASERIQNIVEKFPDLENHKITTYLSMDNSPLKPGPDLFKVKIVIGGNKYKNISIEKSSKSLYVALADVVDHALERLNRYGDKQRVKNRKLAAKLSQSNFANSTNEPIDSIIDSTEDFKTAANFK